MRDGEHLQTTDERFAAEGRTRGRMMLKMGFLTIAGAVAALGVLFASKEGVGVLPIDYPTSRYVALAVFGGFVAVSMWFYRDLLGAILRGK